jgi:hypothetical protein
MQAASIGLTKSSHSSARPVQTESSLVYPLKKMRTLASNVSPLTISTLADMRLSAPLLLGEHRRVSSFTAECGAAQIHYRTFCSASQLTDCSFGPFRQQRVSDGYQDRPARYDATVHHCSQSRGHSREPRAAKCATATLVSGPRLHGPVDHQPR